LFIAFISCIQGFLGFFNLSNKLILLDSF
jgi:hypothetical protein